jgi:hypothetical protein
VARAWTETQINSELESSNSLMLQHLSRVERVTGIEPALSAWELLKLMGMCLVPCVFAVTSGLKCPLDACRNGTPMAR